MKCQRPSEATLQRQLDTLSAELTSVQRHFADATSQNSILSDQLRAAKNKEEAAIREEYESVKRVSELENDLDAWKKYARGLKQKNAEQETELERLRALLSSMEKVARSDTRSSLGDGEGENKPKVKQEED
ncbi:hypothetical protein BDN70DRAFT_363597 [Pholiota conissans]|uniref:Uncharacterized protein n=1 Tax=Pholiota conissans TaxID=109636 RepID=A0A9P6CUZ2_9AGAR|nr:hypothetical protein BDN70DRAFT_363597 [Pholiota conissans]